MSFFDTDTYAVKMIFVIVGTVILGFGVALSVIANVVMEFRGGFCKSRVRRYSQRFRQSENRI